MVKIDGLAKLQTQLRDLGRQSDNDNEGVVVGYTQVYALRVHEDLEAHHKPGKQAKFLEQPAREYSQEISRIIKETYKRTKSMTKSLLAGGLFLQRQSQKIVPVDTGALKNSAFTATESKANEAAQMALDQSQAVKSVIEKYRATKKKK